MSWPPNAVNEPASEANDTVDGDIPQPAQRRGNTTRRTYRVSALAGFVLQYDRFAGWGAGAVGGAEGEGRVPAADDHQQAGGEEDHVDAAEAQAARGGVQVAQ